MCHLEILKFLFLRFSFLKDVFFYVYLQRCSKEIIACPEILQQFKGTKPVISGDFMTL